ncbi:MAG: Yip1 family protein [Eubacteriales bacterium]|nr:YIP1 family protein [Bacillota bacterium]MBV1727528.1 YIP1 family protein [Desulforudis sp.]MDZ4043918.1 Yip1 family protein [Eubacteriales bacterium]MBU4534168.1 YIP1 family protein [Bacillota bacterium]MBU4553414.1 YIP1 family protein [Bacillota bacterium]
MSEKKRDQQEQPEISAVEPAGIPGEAIATEPAVEPESNFVEALKPVGFLELIYGVLFDPVATFRRVALSPPLWTAVVIATLVNLAAALMGTIAYRAAGISTISELNVLIGSLVPLFAIINSLLWYVKWLVYGAVLHLVAQLFGGTNGPKATLSVYALATLPGLLLLPVEGLIIVAGLSESVTTSLIGLAGFAAFAWSLVLLVLGLREVHRFGTSQAIATVFTPVIAILLLGLIILFVAVLGFAAVMPQIPSIPGLF